VKPDLQSEFRAYAELHARRVLTQMDRDPHSPTYGCFDRNYWHYKIRDFPSSILQQAVFLLEALRKQHLSIGAEPALAGTWAVAALNALSRQTSAAGAVDEYFPGEQSYPAAAFGLYAACRVLRDWQAEAPRLLERIEWRGLQRLARHVAKRTELQATNQYAAGVSGLALASVLPEMAVAGQTVAAHAARLFSLQHSEGWFGEYGGPDFGYLTVTLDALADYYEATGDDTALGAIDRAVDFLAGLVGPDGQLPWTLNSRNTDYVVPCGLVRAAARNRTAAWLVETLFADLASPGHAVSSVDDRYHLHYIYASIVRSLPYLREMAPAVSPSRPRRSWLPGCGFWVVRGAGSKHTLYVGARKGGLVRVHSAGDAATAVDHGWRIVSGPTVWTNNWWSDQWSVHQEQDSLTVEGKMQSCRFHVSSPLRHAVLRVAAGLLGRRLAPLLKKVMIFRSGKDTGPPFRREIILGESGFRLRDHIAAVPGATAIPAPRQNLRHVASADSFHSEEFTTPILGAEPLSLDEGGARSVDWEFRSPDAGAGESA
jgi:hypothetical protein